MYIVKNGLRRFPSHQTFTPQHHRLLNHGLLPGPDRPGFHIQHLLRELGCFALHQQTHDQAEEAKNRAEDFNHQDLHEPGS